MSSSLILSELIKEKEDIENNIKKLNLINYNYEIDNENIKLKIIKELIKIIKIKNELNKRLLISI